jgi:L-ascorbate metabolism protein UlaG (beta-lactamase superfamily)
MRVCRLFILGLVLCFVVLGGAAEKKEKEESMSITLQWLGHASFKIWNDEVTIYIDPWKLREKKQDAGIVLVSHSHYDHYSAKDIAKISGPNTKIISSADVIEQEGKGQVLKPGETITAGQVKISGVAAYNPDKPFHPKAKNWLGFVIEIGSARIYYAGDTGLTEEMKALREIEVALLPVGGKYTMDAKEAAEAVEDMKPKKAVPYHWGDIVGKRKDAEKFAEKAKCEVFVLKPGESIKL